MRKEAIEQAFKYFNTHTHEDSYEFAIELLYRLEGAGYCVWQTYSREDIELNLGRKPTEDDMSALQENISNIFEQIRPEEGY